MQFLRSRVPRSETRNASQRGCGNRRSRSRAYSLSASIVLSCSTTSLLLPNLLSMIRSSRWRTSTSSRSSRIASPSAHPGDRQQTDQRLVVGRQQRGSSSPAARISAMISCRFVEVGDRPRRAVGQRAARAAPRRRGRASGGGGRTGARSTAAAPNTRGPPGRGRPRDGVLDRDRLSARSAPGR